MAKEMTVLNSDEKEGKCERNAEEENAEVNPYKFEFRDMV